MKEYDLYYMIKMNRMNKILHKANFLARQKQMISYSGRYIVTEQDIAADQRPENVEDLEPTEN